MSLRTPELHRLAPSGEAHTRRWYAGCIVVFGTVLALLLAGCGSTGQAGAEEPTTWTVEGPLLAWERSLWIVDGTPIVVPSELGLDERRWLGAIVTASGSFDESGQRLAERASMVEGELPNSTLPAATISGEIDDIDEDEWSVSGTTVLVPAATHINGQDGTTLASDLIQTGAQATIEGYKLADGRVLAVNVVLQAALTPESPSATPSTDTAPVAPTESTPAVSDANGDESLPASVDDGDTEQPDGTSDTSDEDNGKPDKPDEQEKPDKKDKPDHDNGKHKGHDADEGSTSELLNDGTQAG